MDTGGGLDLVDEAIVITTVLMGVIGVAIVIRTIRFMIRIVTRKGEPR